MDSKSESEFGPDKTPRPGPGPLPKPLRPKVILPDEVRTPSVPVSSTGTRPASVNPMVPSVSGESMRIDHPPPATTTPVPIAIENESGRPIAPSASLGVGSRPQPPTESAHGLGGVYFLLATAALMFGIWFVGPRVVEEYHYAATLGRTRGEHENAVVRLEQQPLTNVSHAYQLVAQRIRPSVVSVNAIKSRRDGSGLGSGVIMSEDGYIMTNAHVLQGASRYLIELHDRRRFEASLIGADKTSDLAVLKIKAPNLIPATWGQSDDVNVGSIVWAIGSPYGFQQTVTSGIISGKDRPGDPNHKKQSLLQTDAAVNPGNSGGPLVDAQGRVIGINTSIFGDTFQGISFAVPSETAKFVYQQLLRNGKVTRGYLGVYPTEVDHFDALRLKMTDLDGAKLARVARDSPAERAGIRQGDIIRSWNGIEVKEFKNLFRLAETTRPDTRVEVTLLRNGQEHLTEVVVGTLPEQNSWPTNRQSRVRK